ncbi:hypothetical protein ACS0TY_034696 [Phlomoides rotata]
MESSSTYIGVDYVTSTEVSVVLETRPDLRRSNNRYKVAFRWKVLVSIMPNAGCLDQFISWWI